MTLIFVSTFILSSFLPFASPTKVSDDAVWTSPRETFWIGQTDASLDCSFQGTPIAVYWLKGETLQTAMPLITWYKGKSTKQQGEGLEFGPNFSLLFHHPNTSDTGRYFCRVSNQQGILNSNHTDLRVLDPKQNIIYTIPEIIGWKGKSVILPCDFQGTPSLVSWTRERSDEWNTSVQTVAELKDGVSCKTEWNQYACSRGFGLVITDLKFSEEANFTCTVVKTDGTSLKNTTSLSVYAKADHPYPHVDQCEGEEEDSSNRDSTCIIRVTPHQDILELDCIVKGARPPVLITWGYADAPWSLMDTTSSEETELEDGTYLQIITLRLDIRDVKSAPLICMAHGPVVSGAANHTVEIKIQHEKGPSTVGIVVGVICALALTASIVAFIVWRKRISGSRDTPEKGQEMSDITKLLNERRLIMEEKRKEVLDYKPQISSTVSGSEVHPIHLGVFGLTHAGKSAFINSLYFAISGNYESIADESKEVNQRTEWREAKNLTSAIKIIDNKGMDKYEKVKGIVTEFMKQIDGKAGQKPGVKVKQGHKVDCPILICNFSKEKIGKAPTGTSSKNTNNAKEFIVQFSKEVYTQLGRRLVVVLTHKDTLQNEDNIKDLLVSDCEIPRDNIWTFENYTHENHDESIDKTVHLLSFILKCVKLSEQNIEFRRKNETEKKDGPTCLIS